MKNPLDVIAGVPHSSMQRAEKRLSPKSIRQRPTREQDCDKLGLGGHRSLGPFGTPIDASGYRLCLISILILTLAACASTPIPVPEIIHDRVYIPIPATLTAPTAVTLSPGITYGQALGALREGLTSCNGDKSAIGTLKPPNPPKRP